MRMVSRLSTRFSILRQTVIDFLYHPGFFVVLLPAFARHTTMSHFDGHQNGAGYHTENDDDAAENNGYDDDGIHICDTPISGNLACLHRIVGFPP